MAGIEAKSMSHKFDKLMSQVGERTSSEYLAAFASQSNDLDRIGFILDSELYSDLLLMKTKGPSKKCDEKAHKYRVEGNALFQEKKFSQALEKFNASVRFSEVGQGGTDEAPSKLSLTFANRSAALFFAGHYAMSLVDIERSLEHGYPRELRYKLHDRQAKCYIKLGQHDQGKEAFQKAKELVSKSGLDSKEVQTWNQNIDKGIAKCNKHLGIPRQKTDLSKIGILKEQAGFLKSKIPKFSVEKNTKYPAASRAFDVKYSPNHGRGAYATSNIHIGDIIGKEDPYASVLFTDFFDSHCQNCISRVVAPVACPHCSTVVFCNEMCREQAMAAFHDQECAILDMLPTAWVGRFGHLALRVALKAGIKDLVKINDEWRSKTTEDMLKENTKGVFPSDYRAFYSMVTNAESRGPQGLFEFSMMAMYLLTVLRQSKFFGKKNDKASLRTVGGALLRHIQIIQCNAYEIPEMRTHIKGQMANPVHYGIAIYNTFSIINRACVSNVDFTFFNGHTAVFRAISNIPEGEAILDDYGLAYNTMPTAERKAICKSQYFYECACAACKNDWPPWAAMESQVPTFRCFTCGDPLPGEQKKGKAKCTSCNDETDITFYLKQLQESHVTYAQAMQAFMGGDFKKAVPGLKYHLTLLQCYIHPPWQELVSCQTALRHCFRMQGNSMSTV